jgi:membrane-bound ClpP family serine protease
MAGSHEHDDRLARPLAAAPTTELLSQLVKQSAELAKKEVALARAEATADVKRELAAAKWLAIAAVGALSGVTILLVAVAFALAVVMPGWAAALVVGGSVLAIAAIIGLSGWAKRVRSPLSRTQETLKEDVRWAKERMA